jgi:thiol-disulfide isomerase/thioredoxin
LNDINGQPLSLSSLRWKYVLLDFWGSWCTWCKEGFPQMREQYLKYKDQFVILGIDCRDTQEAWRQTVRDFQLPWLHVYCPNDTDLFEKYGILGFPTKILVGPDGRIIKSFTGENPHYYSLIDELFGEVRSLSK